MCWWLFYFRTRLGEPCLRTYPLECVDLLRRARIAFQAGRTLKECFRLTQLEALVRMLEEHECDFVDALGRDLHKVGADLVFSDIYVFQKQMLHSCNCVNSFFFCPSQPAPVWNCCVWIDHSEEWGSSCHHQPEEMDATTTCGKEPGETFVYNTFF